MKLWQYGLAASCALWVGVATAEEKIQPTQIPITPVTDSQVRDAVERGLTWLVKVQGNDGGWGQDGGDKSFVRNGERLESNGNDVANTCVAALALLRSGNTPDKGEHREALQKAIEFVLRSIEESQTDGLALKTPGNTQIQRKLGPYIDTFLASMLLSELDGEMGNAKANARVRVALERVVAKIEKNQQTDGSWNIAGGWAPILCTSIASRSLNMAAGKGVRVSNDVAKKVDEYTKNSLKPGSKEATSSTAASAGVELYVVAQQREQLSRTENDRAANANELRALDTKLAKPAVQAGFGSMGGEEFFSYLNVSDSLCRTGGEPWVKWNNDIKARLVKLQNNDGTWAGHHCITGRVACTGAAILTMQAEKAPATVAVITKEIKPGKK